MLVGVFFFLITFVHNAAIYYVSIHGIDDITCGAEHYPCATINKVITNYPGASFKVSISTGTYITSQIAFRRDAYVVFQGVGNPVVAADWPAYEFVNNTDMSGFEFHDLALTLSGGGDVFALLNGGNTAGFYNVVLSYVGYAGGEYGDFVDINGGKLVFDNVTFTQASFNTHFIFIGSMRDDSNVLITGSAFTNLTFGKAGGLLVFNARGPSNILLNSTTFSEINADKYFIGFWADATHQLFTISNNVFNNTSTLLPVIYIENDWQSIIDIQNTTWSNATAISFASAALGIIGRDDVKFNFNNVTLNGLEFTNCVGNYSGAILVGYNSVVLSNSTFANNSGKYGNDFVQGIGASSSRFNYEITDCFSSSSLPKAVILNLSTGAVIDISNLLPNPSRNVTVRHFSRSDVSA